MKYRFTAEHTEYTLEQHHTGHMYDPKIKSDTLLSHTVTTVPMISIDCANALLERWERESKIENESLRAQLVEVRTWTIS